MGLKSAGFFRNWLGIAVILIGVVLLCVGAYATYPRVVSTSVDSIKANPEAYRDKEVYVFGTVTDRFSIRDYSGIKV